MSAISIWTRRGSDGIRQVRVLDYNAASQEEVIKFFGRSLPIDEQGHAQIDTLWGREVIGGDEYVINYPSDSYDAFDIMGLNELCELFDRSDQVSDDREIERMRKDADEHMADIADDVRPDPISETELDDGGD